MKYRRYPAYKDSGIGWLGEVPAHWEVIRLRMLAEINPSKSEVAAIPHGTEVSFLPMEAISELGALELSQNKPIETVYQGFTYFRDNDVVTAKITPCFENGKGALARGLTNGIAFGTTELHVLRSHDGCIPAFLWWITRSQLFREFGVLEMKGAAGQQRVPQSFVENFPQPTPPIKEQQAIASFLDCETAKIDALIAKQERLIAVLQEKRQALISHAVTKGLNPDAPMKESGVEWLGEVPAHWEVVPVGYRYEVQLGKMLDEKKITGNQLAPYVKNVDVQWDSINASDLPEMDFTPDERIKYALRSGDLLVCEGGEVGRTAMWQGQLPECYYQKAIHRVRRKDTHNGVPRFLFYALYAAAQSGLFVATGNPNTIDHLTAEKLRAHRFPFPPADEQLLLVSFLDKNVVKLDTIMSQGQKAVELLQERRASLISAAVTGKIDVCC